MSILSLLTWSFLLVKTALPTLDLDEKPAGAGEWGYRPANLSHSAITPPAFSWRPQRAISTWELEVHRVAPETGRIMERQYHHEAIAWSVHCPDQSFPPGSYTWHYRGRNKKGQETNWSKARRFRIDANAKTLPLPGKWTLLGRIPKTHPRLFLRPEDMPRFKKLAAGALKNQARRIYKQCDKLLKHPPATKEPAKYSSGMASRSEAWRKLWWGNRTYTIKALNGAATLAFAWRLSGKEEYAQLARRLLLDCAKWDPRGSTGYRYNDEAGMPYAYYFARTYTFLHARLTPQERQACQRVMSIRGGEMYRHLCPRHLWRPYSSHSNRAWHFLGEVGIAFYGEIPAAGDWVWFATNVFRNVYPVWSDEEGGWHEGMAYWQSYLSRFTWWADVMVSALGIDAYEKPFFSAAGYYPIYLLPPGKVGSGFGDLTARITSAHPRALMTTLATQARNPHWQWYVNNTGGPKNDPGYIGFIRGARPPVSPRMPTDLPTSRLFAGIGQAVLNSDLTDAAKSVQVIFKSSPFGTQSHGYEGNNSFLLWAYGQRLLIRTGRRDMYGSAHHRKWMWSSRSTNCITVDGFGQIPRSAKARGKIQLYHTSPRVDIVTGEAGSAYMILEKGKPKRILERFTRTLIFVKPELVIAYDQLATPAPAEFTYWLHAINKIEGTDQGNLCIRAGDVRCRVAILHPPDLALSQTDQYDPNPRDRIKLREWHLAAKTSKKAKKTEFLALFRPHLAQDLVPKGGAHHQLPGGHALTVPLKNGRVTVLLPTGPAHEVSAFGDRTRGKMLIRITGNDGQEIWRWQQR